MKLTLHRFLTLTGLFDNKEDIIRAIQNKEIKVDKKLVTTPKFQINPNSRMVTWKNKKIEIDKKKYYIVFNKPIGFVCEKILTKDSDKKSIFDIIKLDENILNQLSAIGRLDEDTSGMIILTNNGKLNHKIAQPDSHIKKTYEVELEKSISDNEIKKIESGIIIDVEVNGEHSKYHTKPSKIKKISDTKLNITITEGKKREVRKMFESIQNKVITLKRISIGTLKLNDLDIKESEFVFIGEDLIEEKILKT